MRVHPSQPYRRVSEIVAATGATQSNISKHLSLLASAGVITSQKDGLFVYYEMSNPLTMKLCELSTRNR